MNNIINFNSKEELKRELEKNNLAYVGKGNNGVCFKSKRDGLAYKFVNTEIYDIDYRVDDIITEKDIKLSSILFPKTLYTVNNELVYYTSNYISHDYFTSGEIGEEIFNIDIVKLYNAYMILYKDIYILSENNIVINDLITNIMFDGNKLYVVDTTGYYKSNKKNILEKNIKSLDESLKNEFNMFLFYQSDNPKIDINLNIKEYLDEVDKYFKNKKTITK